MKDYIQEYNANAEKHNKRVKSIRNTRLPKSSVAAIDGAISAMDNVHGMLVDGIVHGYHALSMDDAVRLVNAMNDLKREFETRELR